VQHLLIEARAANLNRRDVATVQGARFALPRGSHFRVDHIPGSAEPLLWVADGVAGVVRASRQGSPVGIELLGEHVHVLEVPTSC
jgi:NADPH:quinone reductase-like Zn-dependent oxidoreductase